MIQEVLTENDIVSNDKIIINDSSIYHHVINVMRKEVFSKIYLLNMVNYNSEDKYTKYLAEIIEINTDNIICDILETIEDDNESNLDITIYQAIPKSDRLEYFLEKATELGVNNFKLTEYDRNVVRLDDKKLFKKLDRWNKIVLSAVKQSKRSKVPRINYIKSLNLDEIKDSNYDLSILLYESETNNIGLESILGDYSNLGSNENVRVAIFVGPEGGFTEAEVNLLKEAGAKPALLGKRILRTETAGIALVSVLQYIYGDFK